MFDHITYDYDTHLETNNHRYIRHKYLALYIQNVGQTFITGTIMPRSNYKLHIYIHTHKIYYLFAYCKPKVLACILRCNVQFFKN